MDITIAAEIQRVTVKASVSDGVVLRICRLTLAREFDAEIAAALGGDARKALTGLRDRGMTKVYLPIGVIRAEATLRALDDVCTIPVIRGVTAVGEAPEDDDDVARIKLEMEFMFDEKAWLFLGRNVSGVAQVAFRANQQELRFPRVVSMGGGEIVTNEGDESEAR